MIRFSIKEVSVETDEPKEVVEMIQACLAKLADAFAEKPAEKKTKTRSEINRQNYERRKAKQSEQSEIQTTENKREEREEVSPQSPLSPSPTPLFSYPPISPLPEEKEERTHGGEIVMPDRDEKQAYGSCHNVMLSLREYDELERKLGFVKTQDLIEDLSLYMGQSKKNAQKYTNHYLTILNWNRRDEKGLNQKPKERQKSWIEIAEELSQEMGLD